ncbi:MAG: ATP-binding protein [Candidatus Latescibacterota bacterium]|nr:PAS domain-containing sensor histidine kinase [Opitutaceae bacterium]MEE2726384.1 ATP-binding protein [Candidatus Latescibacterota bacterium]
MEENALHNTGQRAAKAHGDVDNPLYSTLSILIVTDARGVIQSANTAASDLLGYTQEEMRGQPLSILGTANQPLNLQSLEELVRAASHREVSLQTQSGALVPVLLSSSGIYDGAKLTGIVCVALDISRNKMLESQLVQSEKMASIGQLAAGVAHEINNPMGFIYSNLGTLSGYIEDLSQLLRKYETLEKSVQKGKLDMASSNLSALTAEKERIDLAYLMEDIGDLITESLDGANRVRKIVLNLKEFSHVGRAEKMPSDLNSGLESTLNIVSNELKYKTTIEKELGDIPLVPCFMQEINQVFMNLLVNAGQAITDQGTIHIRTYREEDWICVRVTDSGKGMSPEVQKRIFEPFFTTKRVGEGTGLGLSMAYQIIVEKHGGQLLVESTEGQGTTFTVRLPLHG